MSDPASGGFSGVEGFVENHKEAALVIGGLVALVVVYYIFSSGTPAPQTASAPTNDVATESAAAIQGAQITANANAATATLAAGVTNNQTAAAQTVALATIQGQTSASVAASSATAASAYYGAATEIAGANSAVAIAATQAAVTEQTSQNNLLGSEFSNLAAVLGTFGGQLTSQINTTTGAGVAFGQQTVDVANANAATVAANDALAAKPAYTGAAPGGWLNQPTFGFQNPGLVGSGAVAGSGANTSAIAGATLATSASSTASTAATFTSWLSSLMSGFSQSAASSAPKTQAPSATSIASLNLSPLSGGPALPSLAGLSAF